MVCDIHLFTERMSSADAPRQCASNAKEPFDWMRVLLEHWRGTDA